VQPGDGGTAAEPCVPEIVYAPAHQDIRPGHDGDVVFEVRRLADGRQALPVFTTVERLVAALGREQPWVALPLRNVQHLMGNAGVPCVVTDPGVEPGAWRWQVSDLEALGRGQ
jgi:SseB protein N-terminal domain